MARASIDTVTMFIPPPISQPDTFSRTILPTTKTKRFVWQKPLITPSGGTPITRPLPFGKLLTNVMTSLSIAQYSKLHDTAVFQRVKGKSVGRSLSLIHKG